MSIKKFIDNVIEFLGIEDFEKSSKKKSVKKLLKKLSKREEEILNILEQKLEKKEKKELKEELAIITLQIKNGKKLLDELNS